ncbi:ABC transporter permease subunit [soil metagenome]
MAEATRNINAIFKREVGGYFNSPLAYVFIIIFVFLSMAFAFVVGNFIENQEASLTYSFFQWHPWIFMILAPAVGMRLWSEENRLGTAELLLTMPISPWQAIVGKYLAACLVLLLSLVLTFPIVVTVGYLGDPDYGVIWSGYLGSFLVACSALAVTSVVSAFTRSQVVCLIVAVCVCLLLILSGFPPIVTFLRDVGGGWLAGLFQGASFLYHANDPNRGLFRFENLVYFLTVIGFCLFTTAVVIRTRRS